MSGLQSMKTDCKFCLKLADFTIGDFTIDDLHAMKIDCKFCVALRASTPRARVTYAHMCYRRAAFERVRGRLGLRLRWGIHTEVHVPTRQARSACLVSYSAGVVRRTRSYTYTRIYRVCSYTATPAVLVPAHLWPCPAGRESQTARGKWGRPRLRWSWDLHGEQGWVSQRGTRGTLCG